MQYFSHSKSSDHTVHRLNKWKLTTYLTRDGLLTHVQYGPHFYFSKQSTMSYFGIDLSHSPQSRPRTLSMVILILIYTYLYLSFHAIFNVVWSQKSFYCLQTTLYIALLRGPFRNPMQGLNLLRNTLFETSFQPNLSTYVSRKRYNLIYICE